MDRKNELKAIGEYCRLWRIAHFHSVNEVAFETGYSPSSISNFERGSNNNALILSWYLRHGMKLYSEVIENDGKRTSIC